MIRFYYYRACWAFAATGALEALNFKQTRQLVSLSEQQIMDCSKEFGNFGCIGGIVRTAFNYVRANQGIISEDRSPYQARVYYYYLFFCC